MGDVRTPAGTTVQVIALFVEAWLRLLVTDLALRWRSAAGTGLAFPRPTGDDARRPDLDSARICRLVACASRVHLWPIRCLTRALVLRRFLLRHGRPADLCIGVRRASGSLEAHAWVECAGIPLGEPDNVRRRFAPLQRIRAAR